MSGQKTTLEATLAGPLSLPRERVRVRVWLPALPSAGPAAKGRGAPHPSPLPRKGEGAGGARTGVVFGLWQRHAAITLLLLLLAGCSTAAPRAPAPPALAQPPGWVAIEADHFRAQVERLAVLPNAGLQLPAISPDGRWVAFLQAPDPDGLDPAAAFTGKTLANVTLLVQQVGSAAPPRPVATAAAWPAWSPDSKTLWFIADDAAGRSALCLHDLAANRTRRLELGPRRLIAPVCSPSGHQVALVGYAEAPTDARLYVYDLSKQDLLPVPPPAGVSWQVRPAWVNEDALFYLGRAGAEGAWFGHGLRSGRPQRLGPLDLPETALETVLCQSGIDRPLSAEGRWLAVYAPRRDGIVLYDLQDQQQASLPPGSRSGAWLGQGRFLFATDSELRLASPRGASRTMLRGTFLPRWHDPSANQFLVLAPGPRAWTFALLRVHILPTG